MWLWFRELGYHVNEQNYGLCICNIDNVGREAFVECYLVPEPVATLRGEKRVRVLSWRTLPQFFDYKNKYIACGSKYFPVMLFFLCFVFYFILLSLSFFFFFGHSVSADIYLIPVCIVHLDIYTSVCV